LLALAVVSAVPAVAAGELKRVQVLARPLRMACERAASAEAVAIWASICLRGSSGGAEGTDGDLPEHMVVSSF
jgi:hypothetical protein